MRFKDITPEHIAQIKRLHAGGMEIKPMARYTGISRHFIERVLSPDKYQRKVRRECELREQRKGSAFHREHPYKLRVPNHVIAERNRALEFELTPNHVILGDPPPSRSALARRQ
ncbi:MAG: hypothetical protein ACM3IH_20435 [Sphingobacteriales bacterium]